MQNNAIKILLPLLVCIPLLLHAQIDTTSEGIKFEQALSWEQIKMKAKAENKYIFVDCHATWCGPCKMMDRDVYTNLHVGYIMNEHFISVKAQMDSSGTDNEQIKSWYSTARNIMRDYRISSLPTYLFFSTEGKLVHQESGFLDVKNFIRLSKLARHPNKTLYYAQYEAYKRGKKDYPAMGSLAEFTKKIIGDDSLANSMAKDYKKNYLDKLDTVTLYTKEHVDFICTFPNLVHSKDNFFLLSYKNPKRFDSLRNWEGSANWISNQTITQEEIANKVLKNGKAVLKMPAWDQQESNIAKKYKWIDARKIVLTYKITYYRDLYKDWALWATYKDEMIKTYPPQIPYGSEVFKELNGHGGAWHAFLHCPDTTVLMKALEWVDLALKLEGKEDKYTRAAYWDTKANLLYKLGKKEEALLLEKEAVELSVGGDNSEIVETYRKMKRGEPTW